jgi:hypothetical protein
VQNFRRRVFDPEIFDPNIFDTEDFVTNDFEDRTAISYCAFAESADAMKSVRPVEGTILKKATAKFRTITFGTDISW